MPKITPFLWFDHQAEEAANFYTSVFKNSKIISTTRYGDAGPGPKGSVMTVGIEIDGQALTCFNGGPAHTFTDAISFAVHCDSQQEIDDYWEKLTSGGGKEIACGWLVDKFGMSWQIVPKGFIEMMLDPDPQKQQRVFRAMLPMKKLDLRALEAAYKGAQ